MKRRERANMQSKTQMWNNEFTVWEQPINSGIDYTEQHTFSNIGFGLALIILELTNLSRRLFQDQDDSPLILLATTKIKAPEAIPSYYVLYSIADCNKIDDNITIVTLFRKETNPFFLIER